MSSLHQNFEKISDHYLDANPDLAIFLSISKYYGKVFVYSKETISNTLKQAKKDLQIVEQSLNKSVQGDKIAKLEVLVLQAKLRSLIFALEERRSFETEPKTYLTGLSAIQSQYSVKSYAPIETRIGHILSTYQGVLQNINQAPLLLKKKLGKDVIEITILAIQSNRSFLADKLIEFVLQCPDKDLVQQWSQENVKMIDALTQFEETLKTVYMPSATSEFALGYEIYSKMIKYNELVDLTPEELLIIAEKDMERNFKTLKAILAKKGEQYLDDVLNDYPSPDRLFKEAEEATERSKRFMIAKDLITLPVDEQVEVTQMPEAMKFFAFAAMNPAGIGEDSPANESFYYITPPDPTWDNDTVHKYMRSFARGSLENVTIHEVWPGHFLHCLWIKQLKSKIIRQIAFSNTTLEGWAHYTEELAIEQGYDLIDPLKIQVGELMWALVRDVRFISSIKMHTQGMTVEESTQLFMNKAFMSREAALKEARRGTFDPMYYSYTLGKLMIQKLRQDYKKEKGKAFSLKEFHDNFVRYGTPEIFLIRQLILKNPGTPKDIL